MRMTSIEGEILFYDAINYNSLNISLSCGQSDIPSRLILSTRILEFCGVRHYADGIGHLNWLLGHSCNTMSVSLYIQTFLSIHVHVCVHVYFVCMYVCKYQQTLRSCSGLQRCNTRQFDKVAQLVFEYVLLSTMHVYGCVSNLREIERKKERK